ncbi:unnamed protein product [Protopolystoma xenopodis]|uniref:Uncharacterized protein n=1 Tax=Protopolystoma xenopodis TaxID=117903 RepID=A0A448X264_9PLAT|nr:unnamed protein product [Protopolystoma xenopodis]
MERVRPSSDGWKRHPRSPEPNKVWLHLTVTGRANGRHRHASCALHQPRRSAARKSAWHWNSSDCLPDRRQMWSLRRWPEAVPTLRRSEAGQASVGLKVYREAVLSEIDRPTKMTQNCDGSAGQRRTGLIRKTCADRRQTHCPVAHLDAACLDTRTRTRTRTRMHTRKLDMSAFAALHGIDLRSVKLQSGRAHRQTCTGSEPCRPEQPSPLQVGATPESVLTRLTWLTRLTPSQCGSQSYSERFDWSSLLT